MVENRKSYTLSHEKFLKGSQGNVIAIFSPLTRLWYFMEEERNLVPENYDEAAVGHNDIALLLNKLFCW